MLLRIKLEKLAYQPGMFAVPVGFKILNGVFEYLVYDRFSHGFQAFLLLSRQGPQFP
jgi:hypothetical protein